MFNAVLPAFAALCILLAVIACARGGAVIYQSPDERPLESAFPPAPTIDLPAAQIAEPNRTDATGDAIIVPDPATLQIHSDGYEHHLVEYVSDRSAVIVASPNGAPIVIHNDGSLVGRDGCSEVPLTAEGDTRLTVILPEHGSVVSSRFYLVGCAPGTGTLTIVNEGDLLNVYTVTVRDH